MGAGRSIIVVAAKEAAAMFSSTTCSVLSLLHKGV